MTSEAATTIYAERLRKHARAMSNALLKLRPLGGSECFVQVGDEYYADPKFFEEIIPKLLEDLHVAKSRLALVDRQDRAQAQGSTP